MMICIISIKLKPRRRYRIDKLGSEKAPRKLNASSIVDPADAYVLAINV